MGLRSFQVFAISAAAILAACKSPAPRGGDLDSRPESPPRPVTKKRDASSDWRPKVEEWKRDLGSPAGAEAMEAAAASASLARGGMAPDFALEDDRGQIVTRDALGGRWVVLYFYPADDTPGCTCEATQFTALLNDFQDLGASVYGVSANSAADHRFFKLKYDIRVALLSDPERRAMRAYGAWIDQSIGGRFGGRVIRSTFLIDPKGRIAYHWPEVIPQGHAGRVKARLAELRNSLE